MTNHRKTERIKAIAFTTVYDHNMDVLLGFLGNLTLHGAMIIGEKNLERDRDITLRVEFQETSEIPSESLVIPAHIAWVKEQEDQIYFHTGVEFREVSSHAEKIIRSVLEKYSFDEDIVL